MENQFAGQPEQPQQSQPSGNFPGHRYHPSGASRLFQTREDFDAAGPGWRDVPYPASAAAEFAAPSETTAPAKPCETCKKLVSENVGMKLNFDKSWAELKQKHEALQAQHDLLASQNVVLTQQLAEWQGKAQAFEAALNQPLPPPPPQENVAAASQAAAEAPAPTPAAPKSGKNK